VVAACRGTTAGAGTAGVVCATAWVVGSTVVVVWTGAAWTGVCDVGDGVGVVVVGGVLVGADVGVVVGATWRTVAAGVGVGASAPPVSRAAKAAAMTRPAVLRVLIRPVRNNGTRSIGSESPQQRPPTGERVA